MTAEFIEVDIEVVARRVIDNPRRARVSVIEQVALCGRFLEMIETSATIIMPASIAAALALFIQREDACQALDDGPTAGQLAVFQARDAAFQALKTIFEKEFPNA